MAVRPLYTILVTGAVNRDESERVRAAGWQRSQRSDHCQRGPAYTRDGECLRCRGDRLSRLGPAWSSDAALAIPD